MVNILKAWFGRKQERDPFVEQCLAQDVPANNGPQCACGQLLMHCCDDKVFCLVCNWDEYVVHSLFQHNKEVD